MRIRGASIDDVAELAQMIQEYTDIPAGPEQVEELIYNPVVQILVADTGSGLAAAAGLQLGEISSELFFVILPAYTKSRAGKRLLAGMEELAAAAGGTELRILAHAGEHKTRQANSFISKGYKEVHTTFTKRL